MPVKMFVRTKSGREFLTSEDAGLEGRSPEDLMDAFFEEMKIYNLSTLRVGRFLFPTTEIEALWFE